MAKTQGIPQKVREGVLEESKVVMRGNLKLFQRNE